MSQYITPGELGKAFERRARNALERVNYVLVQKNQWNTNYAFDKDDAKKREYDLVMFSLNDNQFYIIECKAHYKPTKYVGLKQVQEFVHKLHNYNGKSAKRMMVTDTDYSYAAKKYAYKNRIMLVNGKELSRIERKGGALTSMATRMLGAGLESIVEKLFGNYSSQQGGG